MITKERMRWKLKIGYKIWITNYEWVTSYHIPKSVILNLFRAATPFNSEFSIATHKKNSYRNRV